MPVFGRFGHLLCKITRRCRADVHTIEVPWGEVFTPDKIEYAIQRLRPRALLTVQGDTSTTMLQPLAELGDICRRHDVLFYTDATASFGSNASITLSPKMEAAIRRRRCVEQGIRTAEHRDGEEEVIYSNYFNLGMMMDYWGPERLNHHTEATRMLFAARECARVMLEEELDKGIACHALHGEALVAGLEGMGLRIYGDKQHKMNNVTGVVIPEGIQGEQIRQCLLNDFAIKIGTSFGPLQGKIWRIGTMGYNARKDCVIKTLSALEAVLNCHGFRTVQGWHCRRHGTVMTPALELRNEFAVVIALYGAIGRRAGHVALRYLG